jgi:hypothetical protein
VAESLVIQLEENSEVSSVVQLWRVNQRTTEAEKVTDS